MAAPQARWSALLEMLTRDGRIEVEPAAEELRVSAATIRRDLDELARQQMVTRTHGGAVINAIAYDLPLRYKAARKAKEKERIADAAAGLVKAWLPWWGSTAAPRPPRWRGHWPPGPT